jgi:hypothetical protein
LRLSRSVTPLMLCDETSAPTSICTYWFGILLEFELGFGSPVTAITLAEGGDRFGR